MRVDDNMLENTPGELLFAAGGDCGYLISGGTQYAILATLSFVGTLLLDIRKSLREPTKIRTSTIKHQYICSIAFMTTEKKKEEQMSYNGVLIIRDFWVNV